jgi:putative inorganic carbon (HCO3(-)) transporter
VRLEDTPQAMAWCALLSVCVSPFLFGSVERIFWFPLSVLWLGLGLASSLISSRHAHASHGLRVEFSRALLPLHALFVLHLVPLPAEVVRFLSPGAHAVHFLPFPGEGAWRPLSVAPGTTIGAWLYVAGLQGLFLCLQGIPSSRRRVGMLALLLVASVLAVEGFWQSRSPEPYRLYGLIAVRLPQGLVEGVFGPYYNRNHFATLAAMGAGIGAGLASSVLLNARGVAQVMRDRVALPSLILFSGTAFLLLLACVASGSRSGTLAGVSAVAFVGLRALGWRAFVAAMTLGAIGLWLSGGAVIDRLLSMNLQASRLRPWADMAKLFSFFCVAGSGPGTFMQAYWPYQSVTAYEFWPHAHNEYLEFMIEGGMVGAVLLALVARRVVIALGYVPTLLEAAIGAAVAMAVQSVLDFPLRITANAAYLTATLALVSLGRGEGIPSKRS